MSERLNYIKIYNHRLCTSNKLSTDKKKHPITTRNDSGLICIEVLSAPDVFTFQFYSLVSSLKGYGRKIVDAVVKGTPDDWNLAVAFGIGWLRNTHKLLYSESIRHQQSSVGGINKSDLATSLVEELKINNIHRVK